MLRPLYQVDRRHFLRLGAGLGAAALARPVHARLRRKVRGAIWLWMKGGMSQFHTWDPEPGVVGAPVVQAIDTAVPGIRVSEWLPVCASQMMPLTLVRSLMHDQVHEETATRLMYTGSWREPLPPIGTVLSRELKEPDFPLPTYLTLDPADVPVRLHTVANPIPHVRRNVVPIRDGERSVLLDEQNADGSARRRQETVAKMTKASAQAGRVMDTPLLKAFRLGEEPPALRQEYGAGLGECWPDVWSRPGPPSWKSASPCARPGCGI